MELVKTTNQLFEWNGFSHCRNGFIKRTQANNGKGKFSINDEGDNEKRMWQYVVHGTYSHLNWHRSLHIIDDTFKSENRKTLTRVIWEPIYIFNVNLNLNWAFNHLKYRIIVSFGLSLICFDCQLVGWLSSVSEANPHKCVRTIIIMNTEHLTQMWIDIVSCECSTNSFMKIEYSHVLCFRAQIKWGFWLKNEIRFEIWIYAWLHSHINQINR